MRSLSVVGLVKRVRVTTPFGLGLFILGCGIASVIGFVFFDDLVLLDLYRAASYWIVLTAWILSAGCFLFFLTKINRKYGAQFFVIFGFALCVFCFVYPRVDIGYRIINDEAVISSVAFNMYTSAESTLPFEMKRVEGHVLTLLDGADKRPLAFPVFVSLLHDFLGFDSYNAFYANALFGLICLLFIGIAGSCISESVWGGLIGIVLFASLPLFWESVASGGPELAQLFGVLGVLLFGYTYLKDDSDSGVCLLFFSALACQMRYESVFLILSVAIFFVMKAYTLRTISVHPSFCLWPFLFLPLAWNWRLTQAYGKVMYLHEGNVPNKIFSGEFVFENFISAVRFVFNLAPERPSSVFLMAIVLAFSFIVLFRIFRKDYCGGAISRFGIKSLGSVSVAIISINVLLLFYFWGSWGDPVVGRLSLPFFLLVTLFVSLLVGMIRLRLRAVILFLGIVYIAAVTVPQFRLIETGWRSSSATYAQAIHQVLRERKAIDELIIITSYPHVAMSMGRPAFSFSSLLNNRKTLEEYSLMNTTQFMVLHLKGANKSFVFEEPFRKIDHTEYIFGENGETLVLQEFAR